MCAGMGVSCLQQLFVAFAGTKSLSVAAVACGSMANISFPAISSIKSKSVPRHEQVEEILLNLRQLTIRDSHQLSHPSLAPSEMVCIHVSAKELTYPVLHP
jgi:hypothetical protein